MSGAEHHVNPTTRQGHPVHDQQSQDGFGASGDGFPAKAAGFVEPARR